MKTKLQKFLFIQAAEISTFLSESVVQFNKIRNCTAYYCWIILSKFDPILFPNFKLQFNVLYIFTCFLYY